MLRSYSNCNICLIHLLINRIVKVVLLYYNHAMGTCMYMHMQLYLGGLAFTPLADNPR